MVCVCVLFFLRGGGGPGLIKVQWEKKHILEQKIKV